MTGPLLLAGYGPDRKPEDQLRVENDVEVTASHVLRFALECHDTDPDTNYAAWEAAHDGLWQAVSSYKIALEAMRNYYGCRRAAPCASSEGRDR